MRIFLSWSGLRSRKAAEAFYNWLPDVLQSVRPWMSSEDICSGAGWNQQIRVALNESNFGIVFVTRDNRDSVWLMFEAGALAKHVDDARVVPLIVDNELDPGMLIGPLGQLQAREASEDKIRRLVRDINFVSPNPLDEERVNRCFATNWPRLESAFNALPAPQGEPPVLDANAMLSQILSILRSESRPSPKQIREVRAIDRSASHNRLLAMLAGIQASESLKKLAMLEHRRMGSKEFVDVIDDDYKALRVFANGNIESVPSLFEDRTDG